MWSTVLGPLPWAPVILPGDTVRTLLLDPASKGHPSPGHNLMPSADDRRFTARAVSRGWASPTAVKGKGGALIFPATVGRGASPTGMGGCTLKLLAGLFSKTFCLLGKNFNITEQPVKAKRRRGVVMGQLITPGARAIFITHKLVSEAGQWLGRQRRPLAVFNYCGEKRLWSIVGQAGLCH